MLKLNAAAKDVVNAVSRVLRKCTWKLRLDVTVQDVVLAVRKIT